MCNNWTLWKHLFLIGHRGAGSWQFEEKKYAYLIIDKIQNRCVVATTEKEYILGPSWETTWPAAVIVTKMAKNTVFQVQKNSGIGSF